MKVREYCYVKRSRSMSVMLRYMYTKYAKFFGGFYSKCSLLKYILVAFGLAPAASIIINNV